MLILKNQLIMTIGEVPNGWTLSKEMIMNSLDTYANKPIVWNKKQEFKDYRDMENYKNNQVIGMILEEPNLKITDKEVYADIMIMNDNHKHLWTGKFDNWCITISDDKKSFELESIEVF